MMKKFEKQMKAQGFALCEECGFWCNDVKPCEGNRYVSDPDSGYAYHDVPTDEGNLCGDCMKSRKAHPKD